MQTLLGKYRRHEDIPCREHLVLDKVIGKQPQVSFLCFGTVALPLLFQGIKRDVLSLYPSEHLQEEVYILHLVPLTFRHGMNFRSKRLGIGLKRAPWRSLLAVEEQLTEIIPQCKHICTGNTNRPFEVGVEQSHLLPFHEEALLDDILHVVFHLSFCSLGRHQGCQTKDCRQHQEEYPSRSFHIDHYYFIR